MSHLLKRKEELNAEIKMVNDTLTQLETLITIYSNSDMIRVEQLAVVKRELEMVFLDVLNESNDLWLHSIKSA